MEKRMDPLARAEDNIVKRAADTRGLEQKVVDVINEARQGPVRMRPAIVPGFYGRLNVGIPGRALDGSTAVPVSLVSNGSFNHPLFVGLSADEMRQVGQDLLRMARCIDEQEQGSAEGEPEQERPAELVSISGLPEGARIVYPCGCQSIMHMRGWRSYSKCSSVPCQRGRL